MKKTYISPSMKAIRICTASLVATSLGQRIDTASTSDGEYNKALSREFDYYDDEEFEDE